MIRFEDVSKVFADGTVAVADLNLEIADGETVVLVGPSGCGKTTTLRMINRLEEVSSGRVLVDGHDVADTDPTALRRGMGYVIQHVGLLPHRSVRDNIATVPWLLGWPRERIQERIAEMLRLMGLDAATVERYPHQLSGGQQQRVGVARALAGDPGILLMDEPFAAVDPIVRAHLQQEFLDLKQRVKKTIVFVTHDIDEAITLGDRIALFREDGRLAQFTDPIELLTRPADAFVAEMLGRERTLKRFSLIRVGQLGPANGPVASPDAEGDAVVDMARAAGRGWVAVVDGDGRFVGWCDSTELTDSERAADRLTNGDGTTVAPADSLRTALDAALSHAGGLVAVVDGDRRFHGTLSLEQLAEAGR